MNAAEAAALRQACEHVEDHRLAAMADVVVAGGTLAAATDAVRTSTSFGALTESGEIHATSAGLRVRLGDRAQRSRELVRHLGWCRRRVDAVAAQRPRRRSGRRLRPPQTRRGQSVRRGP